MVATVHQHARVTLASRKYRSLPNEKRRKAEQNEHTHREGHAVQARPVKTFRNVGDIKKETADL